jgi:hypothetical protein
MIKSRLRQHLAATTRQDPSLALIDSLLVPVCHFARASLPRLSGNGQLRP